MFESVLAFGAQPGHGGPIYIYEALSRTAIRNLRDVSEESKRSSYVSAGQMICADLCEGSCNGSHCNGPFLRLQSYDGGFLFVNKHDQKLFKKVEPETGLWALKVVSEVGIALRQQPFDNHGNVNMKLNWMVKPLLPFPKGYIVICDVKVTSSKGQEFYRVQGTTGWVFPTRYQSASISEKKYTMMEEVSVDGALSRITSDCKSEGENALSLEAIRLNATYRDLIEVQHNVTSRVIAFEKHRGHGTELGPVRINVYYTTGTVGTCLCHPKQGKTQLFRRKCTIHDLVEIFEHPRWHSGRGYQTKSNSSVLALSSSSVNDDDESSALRYNLLNVEAEIAKLVHARKEMLEALVASERPRLASAIAK
eukprot:g2663.t1